MYVIYMTSKILKMILSTTIFSVYFVIGTYQQNILEQILEETPHEITDILSPSSHLTNPLSKWSKTGDILLEKQVGTHKRRFL